MSAPATAEVVPGVSRRRDILRRQLASLAVPARTAALIAGLAPGPGPLDAACIGASLVLRQLVDALVCDETDDRIFQASAAALSGLGPGLTPTGDDLLVALLVAGRHLCDMGLLASAGLTGLARAVAASPSARTTPTATHWLGEACDGRAPSALAHFVQALGNPEVGDHDLADRCAQLVATGAHSGADWLAGVIALWARCCEAEGVWPRRTPALVVPPREPALSGRGELPHLRPKCPLSPPLRPAALEPPRD